MKGFTGTMRLVRLNLRRDRVRTPVWLIALALTTVATANSFLGLYADPATRQTVAETMASPAGLAMTGPARYLDDYNFGSMMGHQMIGFMGVLVALMTILMVVRHTRTEEQTGRAEVVRAAVVGRHAHLTAALTSAIGVNMGLGLLIAVGLGSLGIEGIDWSGSLLYGAGHVAVGIAFAGVAAVTVQMTEHSRGASGMAIGLIGLAYILRAIGDIGEGFLSWLSPIGWAQRTYVFVDNRWWPLLLCVAFGFALGVVGYALSTMRDLGAGLRATRPGTPTASPSLLRPVGFAFRLHRGMVIGFGVAMFITGTMYGSVYVDFEEIISGIDIMEDALSSLGGGSLSESFASFVMIIMSVIASIYVVIAALRPKAEENGGRAEPVLSTGLSRTGWLGSHLVLLVIGGALVTAMTGLGFGLLASATAQDPSLLPRYLLASLAYIPAVWVTGGVAVALFGLIPRATVLAWLVPLYAFVVGYLGQILQFPEWMTNLSPFGHIPQVPVEDLTWAPLLILT
ncbi:MAG: ABC transporter permease, partial [Acidimicrobiia bacterium]|nr:ABC transporter permease [Acidimicrobiia bacterium]